MISINELPVSSFFKEYYLKNGYSLTDFQKAVIVAKNYNNLSKEKLKNQYDCFVALSLEAASTVAPLLGDVHPDRAKIIEENWHELVTDALAYGTSYILGQDNVSKSICREEYLRLTGNKYVIDDKKLVHRFNNGTVTKISEQHMVDYWDRMGIIRNILSATEMPYLGEVLGHSYIGLLIDFYNHIAMIYGKDGITKYEIIPAITELKNRVTEISGIKDQ